MKKILRVIAAIYMMLSLSLSPYLYFVEPVYAATDPALYLSPFNNTLFKNTTYEVEIRIFTVNTDVDASDVIINYIPNPTDALSGDMITFSASTIQQGVAFTSYINNSINTSTRTLTITGYNTGSPLNTGSASAYTVIGSFSFTPIRTGTIDFEFDFQSPGLTTDSNIVENTTSNDILGEIRNAYFIVVEPPATPTPVPTSTPYPTGVPTPTVTDTPIPTTTVTPSPTTTPTSTPSITPTEGVDLPETGDAGTGTMVTITPTITGEGRTNSQGESLDTGSILERISNIEDIDDLAYVASDVSLDAAGTVAVTGAAIQLASFATALNPYNIVDAGRNIASLLFGVNKPSKDVWGIVYNSKTNKPVPFVILRLFEASTKKLITSTVTDLEGRYGIPADNGEYYIEAKHHDYSFPSKVGVDKIISTMKSIYTGGNFAISSSSSIDFNIPLDPNEFSPGFSREYILSLWIKIRLLFVTANFYLTVVFFIMNLFLLVFRYQVIYLILTLYYLFFLALNIYQRIKKPKAWGLIFDSISKKPISAAFVKLYNEEGELVNNKMSDDMGRFQFLVPNGTYYLLVSAVGYEFPSKSPSEKQLEYVEGRLKIITTSKTIVADIPMDKMSQTEDSNTFLSRD